MEVFKTIDIKKEETSLDFLIAEALENKAPFAVSAENTLQA